MWNLKKKVYKSAYLQNRNRVIDKKINLWLLGSRRRGNKLEDWGWHIHTAIYKIGY